MVKRRKGFTATQSKLTSRRMRSATLGTHVPRRSRSSSRHMNADSVGFSNVRKNKRAARGIVDTLLPSTATRESSSDYSRRVGRREFTQEIQRRTRVRRIVIVLACVLVAVGVASGVGIAAFFGSLDAKMGLGDSNAKTALVAPAEAAPYYVLVSADLDAADNAATAVAGPDALVLARIDEANRAVSLVSLPANLRTTLSDGKSHQLRDAPSVGGDAALVSAVAGFAGVDVSHYVKLDAAGVVSLVDGLGGIEVDVVEEVDDPTAGDAYLAPGVQTLGGKEALTFLRASNFKNGLETQAANQRALLSAVAARLPGDGSLGFLTALDSLGGFFKTDVAAADALAIADKMRGIDPAGVPGALVPGYETTRDGVTYYVASTDSWTSMTQRFKEGQSPVAPETEASSVDPASFTVTVRNGAAITGGATQMADILKARGFKVEDVGNTDTAVYSETLVVYNDAQFKLAAESVVKALGLGRTVVGGGYYEFETDVLVVLGKDWTPVS